jgi:glycosyltransferase involved in cell wall biosynthesis
VEETISQTQVYNPVMTSRVDFVQGADALAPGIARVQQPLLAALSTHSDYDIRPLTFPTLEPRLLFPYMYGLLPAELLLDRAGLVHFGNTSYAHLVPLLKTPAVVTCHHPMEPASLEQGGARARLHWRFHFRASLAGTLRARIVVTDSCAVARQLQTLSSSLADRLRVIYPGISRVFSPQTPPGGASGAAPYVLYVGSEQIRKNLPRLVSAVAIARQYIPELHFVKVGGHQTPSGRAAFLAALHHEGLEGQTRILDDVSDSELAGLYRTAAVTVLPSFEEGFGFPPLEAMACGCPAIVSNRGSLPEVTGGAALVVDPMDVRGLAEAIRRVVSDSELQADLTARGIARASSFTWDRAAAQYENVYDEALRVKVRAV